MTNNEKIQSLNKRQLADFILNTSCTYDTECMWKNGEYACKNNCNCIECVSQWLSQEYKLDDSHNEDELPGALTWCLNTADNNNKENL